MTATEGQNLAESGTVNFLPYAACSRFLAFFENQKSVTCLVSELSSVGEYESSLRYEGPATKSGLRNSPMQKTFIGLSCGADQCGFN